MLWCEKTFASNPTHFSIENSSHPLAWAVLMENYNNPSVMATGRDNLRFKCTKSSVSLLMKLRTWIFESPQAWRSYWVFLSTLSLRSLGPGSIQQFEISLGMPKKRQRRTIYHLRVNAGLALNCLIQYGKPHSVLFIQVFFFLRDPI